MYRVRKLKIGTSEQLDSLALASGELYSEALIYFWRVVRRKGIWLSSGAMEKICLTKKMHAHSADAVVQSIFHALSSWRARREIDPKARPPRGQRKYFKLTWKKSAIRLKALLLFFQMDEIMSRLKLRGNVVPRDRAQAWSACKVL